MQVSIGTNRGMKAFNNELVSSSPRSKGSISGGRKFAPVPCLLPPTMIRLTLKARTPSQSLETSDSLC